MNNFQQREPLLGVIWSRKSVLLDTTEQGARVKIVKGAGRIKIVIREQGAPIVFKKRQQRTNLNPI